MRSEVEEEFEIEGEGLLLFVNTFFGALRSFTPTSTITDHQTTRKP